jgi:hypothetical protein
MGRSDIGGAVLQNVPQAHRSAVFQLAALRKQELKRGWPLRLCFSRVEPRISPSISRFLAGENGWRYKLKTMRLLATARRWA